MSNKNNSQLISKELENQLQEIDKIYENYLGTQNIEVKDEKKE
ncbi:MAG: hypothetical protein ACQESP_08440 [Candidatus Muiribacteriota bacterium]